MDTDTSATCSVCHVEILPNQPTIRITEGIIHQACAFKSNDFCNVVSKDFVRGKNEPER